jgi:perosamine synthetase
MTKFLPYSRHSIDSSDIAAITEALQSDYLTTGPRIKEFEEALAKAVGAKYAVAVSNGTAALHCAVMALQLPKGSLGITSPITFVASSNCLLYEGLRPAFCDIDPNTANMDPSALAASCSREKPRVIIPVHFGGQACEMQKISEIAKASGSLIIEDAAHALGGQYENGKQIGCCEYSAMTTLSFHPVKNITCGEGGAITTNDPILYERLLQARSHGINRDPDKFKIRSQAFESTEAAKANPWYYEMVSLGYNYRLTDIQAALATSQLKKLDYFIKKRREIFRCYVDAFRGLPGIRVLSPNSGELSALHLAVILIDFNTISKSRAQVIQDLHKLGIGSQVHYIPVHLQPYYRETFGFSEGMFPKAESYYANCLSIPIFPDMTQEDIDRVISAIQELSRLAANNSDSNRLSSSTTRSHI